MGSGKMEALTRIGFAARGIMYVLIGYLALRTGRAEDGAGALETLDGGAGRLLLGVMALGFLAYALWRLSSAAVDSDGHGSDAKGMAARGGGAISGLVHLALGFTTAALAVKGTGGGSGGGNAEAGAATALQLPGGYVVMILIAFLLAATGAMQLVKAYKDGFLRTLDQEAASRSWVRWMGRAGYAARGIVFLIMGWFFWQAAQDSNASRAGDMGQALASLPDNGVELAVAAGLLLFGLFSLVEARYRRIADPHIADRLRNAAA
jgi:hypothetical protein